MKVKITIVFHKGDGPVYISQAVDKITEHVFIDSLSYFLDVLECSGETDLSRESLISKLNSSIIYTRMLME